MNEHYFSAQRKPSTRRKLNQQANDLADVDCPHGIDETAADAEIFDAAFVDTGNPMPFGSKVDPYALVGPSFVAHGRRMVAFRCQPELSVAFNSKCRGCGNVFRSARAAMYSRGGRTHCSEDEVARR